MEAGSERKMHCTRCFWQFWRRQGCGVRLESESKSIDTETDATAIILWMITTENYCDGITRRLVVDDRCGAHNGWDPLKVILEHSINC